MNTYFVDATAAASLPNSVFLELNAELMNALVPASEGGMSFPMSGDHLARKRADA